MYLQLAVALGLGLLVGLQRQHAGSRMAGIRTFPMITLLGAVCAMLAETAGGWVIAAGLVGVAAMIIVSNLLRMQEATGERRDRGMTTEAAALLMFGVGAACVGDYIGEAVVVGGAAAVLLQAKQPLHQTIARIGERDIRAIFQFVLISMVILPVLPDRDYPPLDVLNPRKIWLMVVLIVGLGLAAYVIYKLLGAKVGSLLGGVLGGMISSTATTVSYARTTAGTPEASGLAAAVIMIASTVALVRVLVEIAVVAPGQWWSMGSPIGAMLGVMVLVSVAYFWRYRGEPGEMPEPENPTELKAALVFGALYAVIIVAVAGAKQWLGTSGLYAVAAMSGLTDMDAITLSTAQLAASDGVKVGTAWRMIMLASLCNLAFKGAMVAMLGERRLMMRVGVLFGLAMAAGVVIMLAWPS